MPAAGQFIVRRLMLSRISRPSSPENVEVSQMRDRHAARALGGSCGRAGSMNNVTGQRQVSVLRDDLLRLPAGPGFPGTDVGPTHMTNTQLPSGDSRIRYPVLLEDFIFVRLRRQGKMERGRPASSAHPTVPHEDGIYHPVSPSARSGRIGFSRRRRTVRSARTGAQNDGRMDRLKCADATVVDAGEAISHRQTTRRAAATAAMTNA